ncbi:hypothetical protein [Lysobacter sp. 22409]|uniref:hypothetical protein n=1 Tax=Lysobacter sp. 22409 TaxID=3453917 RepID=UPI003F850D15
MRPARRLARRRLAICVACTLASAAPAASAADASPLVYRDRIIAAQALAPLPPDEDETVDGDGLPRSFRLELNAAYTERGDEHFGEQGLAAGGFWETANWGSLSLDATVFHSDRDRFADDSGWGGAATLWQRNLFVDGGWRLDNGLGVINTPSSQLQRNQYRFFLPSVAMAGLSTQWTRDASGLSVYGAVGRAGLYNGTRVVGFDVADGHVGAFGAQWQGAPGWTHAVSALSTDGRIVPDDVGEPGLIDRPSQAAHWASAWRSDRDAVQLNLLGSHDGRGNATGAWIDASSRRGRYRHHYGLFSLDPGLTWGASPINQDVRGGYYRLAYQYGRWSWNTGVDDIRSISGAGFDGQYATAFARYQASSVFGYGASLSLRHADDDTYAAQLFADRRNDWGQTRLQFDHAGGGGGVGRSWQASIDQALPLREGRRLSVSLGYGEWGERNETSSGVAVRTTTRTTTFSMYGGVELGDRVSVDGTARWTHGEGPAAMRGVDMNLGINWRIAPRWSLTAALYQSQGSQRSPFALDPLIVDSPFLSLPRERSAFLTLRYERQAGRALPVIGGAPGSAVGSIDGSLFLDDNDDGVRAASEQAAPNVTVVLDGRYAVRTDSNGQFSFPRVSIGKHTIAVIPDNLPLPWAVRDDRGLQSIEVGVRRSQRVDIPATRQR